MKLYVWEEVLLDWSSGIMFALADNEEHAKGLIKQKMTHAEFKTATRDFKRVKPRIITEPEGFVSFGGS